MLSPKARSALGTAFAAAIASEIARRAEQPESDAAGHLLDELGAMAERLQVLARPGDRELADRLRTLARGKDRLGFEEVRIAADLSPAEAVALIMAAGDPDAALQILGQHARRG